MSKTENLDYSTIVSVIRERNRPSGGIKSIQTTLANSFLTEKSVVLEIGCNTGFTSVNIAALRKCKVIGIDINAKSLKEARRYAKENKVGKLVQFIKADATKLPFKKNYFDLVWISNTTSFIGDKERAIQEYLRVLKCNGTLAVIPIYYLKKPPISLLKKISDIIGVPIHITSKQDWIKMLKQTSRKAGYSLDLYFEKDYSYINQEKRIPAYVNEVFNKPHLKMDVKNLTALKNYYSKIMHVFNKNLFFAGYSILLLQKRHAQDEMELFLTKEVEPK